MISQTESNSPIIYKDYVLNRCNACKKHFSINQIACIYCGSNNFEPTSFESDYFGNNIDSEDEFLSTINSFSD